MVVLCKRATRGVNKLIPTLTLGQFLALEILRGLVRGNLMSVGQNHNNFRSPACKMSWHSADRSLRTKIQVDLKDNQTVNDGVAHSKNPRKCAYHVIFDLDLDLDLEHTLDAC